MPVRVRVMPDGKEIEVDEGVTALQVLKAAGMSSESGVVLVNGRPVTEDYRVRSGDDIVVVRVLSGG